jgi:hypothetical protein
MKQGLLEKSKLSQLAYEGHRICWKEAKVLQTEPNTTYRKYKESAHMSLVYHLIRQPSLDVSPVWTLVITAEAKRNYYSVQCRLNGKIVFFVLVPYGEFVSPVVTSILLVLWCKASYVESLSYFNVLSWLRQMVCAVLGLYTISDVGTGVQR